MWFGKLEKVKCRRAMIRNGWKLHSNSMPTEQDYLAGVTTCPPTLINGGSMDKELVKIFGVFILFVVVFWGALIFILEYSCSKKAVSFQDSKYSVFTGCMVKKKDQWLPLANIRRFD